jgi:hypothetical protein
VAQAVVAVVTGPAGQQQLAAYLRARPGAAVASRGELRELLARTLPAHMIPAYLIAVDELPLTTSGKIDKAALPAPELQAPDGYVEPATLLEAMVADMYARLLSRAQVGATESFFDIGGNSLAAMRLIALMDDELEVDIGAAAVFLAPAPRALAALLRDKHGLRDAELGASGLGDLDELVREEPGTSAARVG